MSDVLTAATSGSPSIDAEHLIQTELIRAVCAAINAGEPAEAVGKILGQLISYSECHFMSEEMLMRLASYDQFDDHVADHDQMLAALQDIAERHRAGESALVIGQAEAMLAFLVEHIQTRDRRFQTWKTDAAMA